MTQPFVREYPFLVMRVEALRNLILRDNFSDLFKPNRGFKRYGDVLKLADRDGHLLQHR